MVTNLTIVQAITSWWLYRMSIVKKEEGIEVKQKSWGTSVTNLVLPVVQKAVSIEKKKKESVKLKKDFADCLEECIEKGIDFPLNYRSPCGGRCPNGIVGELFDVSYTDHIIYGHTLYVNEWCTRGIEIHRSSLTRCPEPNCGEPSSDDTWAAYHMAHYHKYTLEQLVEYLRKRNKKHDDEKRAKLDFVTNISLQKSDGFNNIQSIYSKALTDKLRLRNDM